MIRVWISRDFGKRILTRKEAAIFCMGMGTSLPAITKLHKKSLVKYRRTAIECTDAGRKIAKRLMRKVK